MTSNDYLDAAVRIGRRLARQALWQDSRCTWEIKTSDRSNPGERRAQTEQAGGMLYQGSCGIAWFLAELFRETGEEDFGRTAEGALRHALAAAEELPTNNFGFHSGRVGIAWVAAGMATAIGREELLQEAWDVLAPLVGNELQDRGVDVISGAAGAIPALLELGDRLGRDEPVTMARRLGDGLIATAHREPDGWSWATVGGSEARHLNGLAHGASGFGLAFLELFQATGEGAYRFAAEMAFLYERQFFDPETSNWPDFRHQAIGDMLYYGRLEELREAAAAGVVPKYQLKYMTAWCHGSPGIGLARIRAYELTGQTLYRQEAEAALRSTLPSLAEERLSHDNYSLCHGIGGNCELPLMAAQMLDEPKWREPCERAAEVGLVTYEQANRPWLCGTLSGDLDPSLLLGEAGIGAFYLRLAVPDLPSVLLLRPQHGEVAADRNKTEGDDVQASGFEQLAQESVEGYFGLTLRALDSLAENAPRPPIATPGEGPLERSPAAATFDDLKQWLEQQPESTRAQLEDAVQLDCQRFERTRELTDFYSELLDGMIRPAAHEVDWFEARFRLAPGGHLVNLEWDWPAWLAEDDLASEPESEETVVLLYRQDNRLQTQAVGALAALVLRAVQHPTTLEEIVEQIADALDGGASLDREVLTAKVLPQLQQLYQVGFVDGSDPVSWVDAVGGTCRSGSSS